jgi:ketosteroid isomerase-like protein
MLRTRDALHEMAQDWIDAWNSRDLDRICRHYRFDVEIWSPTVPLRWGVSDGRLAGLENVRRHFERTLAAAPALRFELLHALEGIDGHTVVYRRETGTVVADVVTLDEHGKIRTMRAFFSARPTR